MQNSRLLECMHQPGCPLCRATWKMDTAQFGWYANDGVLDEETQRKMIRAVGFCAPHALSLSLIEGSDVLWSHLGSCMVYVNVIEHALLPDLERFLFWSDQWFPHPLRQKVFSSLRHLFHHDLCPLCFDHRQHEAPYREQFAEALSTNEDFRQAYLQADNLCVPHFQQIRSSLAEEYLVHMLDMAEFHALKRCEQASRSAFQHQFRQYLCLLYGGETILWSDFIPRAAISASEANPISCLACQETEQERTRMITAFLNHLVAEAPFAESGQQPLLALCSWHAWWLLNQSS